MIIHLPSFLHEEVILLIPRSFPLFDPSESIETILFHKLFVGSLPFEFLNKSMVVLQFKISDLLCFLGRVFNLFGCTFHLDLKHPDTIFEERAIAGYLTVDGFDLAISEIVGL